MTYYINKILILDIVAAYIIDLIVGDPYWLPHPVRFIGYLISKTETVLGDIIERIIKKKGIYRKSAEKASKIKSLERTQRTENLNYLVNMNKVQKMEGIAGGILALVVVLATFLAVFLILEVARYIHPTLFHILNIYFIYSAFATRCMTVEAMKVYERLTKKDLKGARKKVGMLVGRETCILDEEEVIRAVVETTAESTLDGVISPIFYAILGSIFGIGAPVAYVFKAVSTLDSMVGYTNEKYKNLGRVSARLDDVLNYIPARLSGVIIPVAAFVCGKGFKDSFLIMLRDRKNHKSPNSAYPEGAVAGALGVRLGGANVYFGKVVEKPTIGDAKKQLEVRGILDTIKIMMVSSFITLLIGVMILILML